MKTMAKPHVRTPPPPRTGWHYDNYFLEQLAKLKPKANNNHFKNSIA
jgi:hypothetical protein